MNNTTDLQLSEELQELYLENKEWVAKIDFLKDELRFFNKLFAAKQLNAGSDQQTEALNIQERLNTLAQQIQHLTELTAKHQKLITTCLTSQQQKIGIALIEQNYAIQKEVTELLAADQLIKKSLFALVESKNDKL